MQNAKHQVWNTGGIQYMYWRDFSLLPSAQRCIRSHSFIQQDFLRVCWVSGCGDAMEHALDKVMPPLCLPVQMADPQGWQDAGQHFGGVPRLATRTCPPTH